MTENIYDRTLGVILSAPVKDQKIFINAVDKDWFNNHFHSAVYDGIYALASDNIHVDIMNLIQWLRDQNRLDSDFTYRIAGLNSNIGITDLMNVNSIFNECYYHYSTTLY